MKAKKYRLETVLNIRDLARDEAARQAAVRLQQLQTAEAELRLRREKLEDCRERQARAQAAMNENAGKGIRAREILAHRNYLNDLRVLEIELLDAVEKQIQIVCEAENELAAAREKLAESARDLKSIETHKAHWLDSQAKENARREQKINDEISTILHTRRKSS